MQHETRAQQARARLAEITVERHEHEARLSALRKAREDATPVEPVDGVLAWTLRIMLLVLVVGPSAIFMAVKDVPLVANLAMNGALAALILFVPKGALGPVRGDMPPETAEMRAEREVLRSLEREAENLYDDLDDESAEEEIPVAPETTTRVTPPAESPPPERAPSAYRDAAESALARVEELRPKLEAIEAERRTLERALLSAVAREPETEREEQTRIRFRLLVAAIVAVGFGTFLGVALVGEPLSKRIVLGTILAILAFMGGMAIAITAAPSARTKAQRDALLVEAKRRKLGGLDVAATRKRLAELEREGATIEGEMEESRMLVRVDTSNDEADEPEEHRVVDDDAGARR